MKHELSERTLAEQQTFVRDPTPPPPATPTGQFAHGLWQRLVARRGIVAYVPLAIALLLLLYGVSRQLFSINADTAHYQCYAVAFWQGSAGTLFLPAKQCSFFAQFGVSTSSLAPFHLLPFEYPPLTLSLFSLELLAPSHYYTVAFALVMALAALGIYWLLLRYGPRGAALACAFYLVIGTLGTAEARFDLVPAGLTLLCLIAAQRRHWTLAYVALAFGVLLKIYPLLLLPALFLAEQIAHQRLDRPSASLRYRDLPRAIWQALRGVGRWQWKNLAVFWGLILAISAGFALINFQGAVVSQLSYFVDRPIQVESTGSTLLWLAAHVGYPAHAVRSFGSTNIISPLDHRVAFVQEVCFFLGYLLALLQQWRGRFNLTQTFLAMLLVFIVTGKVFSPQYLIWIIPLLAYNGSFHRVWLLLWGGFSILTTTIYPYMYQMAAGIDSVFATPHFIILVALRNLFLIVITLAFFGNWWNIHRRSTAVLISAG